ncbi:PD-(D/E)XK nuclease family protein [Flaviflexus equikiangi]|uniref:PD-(D/E)XK nuclease family protein n=1 Tax=Flaviflexus equikiangi TaxID=2758573 RepID=A0ABS2TCK6_9ACTO|nr:PD-(D/E)XK nuclease family protein [Flaviflexus equikiangi]MBM9432366.1 PD-(D/E)XK nuclease family protein [Flaviflexus equikiangi]
MKWKARMTAIGMAQRDDLILQARAADPDDKKTLGRIAEQAAEHAGSAQRATIGTELHALTERLDRGETLPHMGAWQADLDAYQRETSRAGLDPVEIETFTVNDSLKIGGTFDRVFEVGGRRFIGDLKTGSSLDWGTGTFAMQLAVYANSLRYDLTTGGRSSLDVSTDHAILIHLPAGTGKCEIYWLDIARGWASVSLAAAVREFRKIKRDTWLRPFQPIRLPTIEAKIQAATNIGDLTDIWADHHHEWTSDLTALAARKKASLQSANPNLTTLN